MKITDIKINEGRRKIDPDKVKELAQSIEQVGLLNPITISNKGYLIAGAHRIEAFKLLKIANIPHTVVELEGLGVELAEIDENLMRNEIHFVERGELLLRRKQIYEELYPETKQGSLKNKGNQHVKVEERNNYVLAESFTEKTAKTLGVSKSSIEQEIKIAKLPEEIKEQIIENKLGKVAALKLAMKPTNGKAKLNSVKPKPINKKDFSKAAYDYALVSNDIELTEAKDKEFNLWYKSFNKTKL